MTVEPQRSNHWNLRDGLEGLGTLALSCFSASYLSVAESEHFGSKIAGKALCEDVFNRDSKDCPRLGTVIDSRSTQGVLVLYLHPTEARPVGTFVNPVFALLAEHGSQKIESKAIRSGQSCYYRFEGLDPDVVYTLGVVKG